MNAGGNIEMITAAAGSVEIRVCGQHIVLLPERAMFWRETKTLVAADPHFGKAQVFRDRGIPVPAGTTAADLGRLSNLIDRLDPATLLFLGDLVHGALEMPDRFTREIGRWRDRHADLRMTLVTGNHDLAARRLPAAFRLDETVPEQIAGPFVLTHKPVTSHTRYVIAGHLHPAVTLKGKGRMKETLPCFSFGRSSALLPAFGGFTGTQVTRPRAADRIFVVAGDEVVGVRPIPAGSLD